MLFVMTLICCGCHGDWAEIGDKGYVYANGTVSTPKGYKKPF